MMDRSYFLATLNQNIKLLKGIKYLAMSKGGPELRR